VQDCDFHLSPSGNSKELNQDQMKKVQITAYGRKETYDICQKAQWLLG
jgi:hypothetical protein